MLCSRDLIVSFLIPPDTIVPFNVGVVRETKTRPCAEVPPKRMELLLPR